MADQLQSPFFVEATDKTLNKKLSKLGVKGGKVLPPPIAGISEDGRMWEVFMHTTKDGKKGWMVHFAGRRVKPEFVHKYFID